MHTVPTSSVWLVIYVRELSDRGGVLCLGFLLGCTVFQCESPRALTEWVATICLVESSQSHQLYVIVAGLQGMTLPSIDNSYTYYCIDQLLWILRSEAFKKKIQVISSGTHVLYTDTPQPEYWCCVKILGDCFGCIQGLTKCHPPPLKPYSIECSLRLQLPSDSCSHLWQNRSGWSGCLDFAEYAQCYTWPKMSYNGAFSSKSTKKIPLFIFRVNVFSKATKALMYPHSSYSLLINFETFCLERNYLFSLRRYSHLHIHKSYSLMLLASLPSKFLI